MSDAQARAAAAKRLVEDPMLQEAFENVRKSAILIWMGTKTADVQEREFAWLTVKAIDRIEGELESIIANGEIAARRLQRPMGSN